MAELKRLWAGGPAYDGGEPVGPAPYSQAGPPLWAAAMGPRSMARAARWADGITGFSIGADPDEIARVNRMALDAWEAAGPVRAAPSGERLLLPAGRARCRRRTQAVRPAYLAVFGDRAADALSQLVGLSSPARLLDSLAAAEAAGCDEFILVPGTVDPDCLASDHGRPGRLTGVAPARPHRPAAGRTGCRLRSRSPRPSTRPTPTDGSREVRTRPRDLALQLVDLALQRAEGHPDQVGQQGVVDVGGRRGAPAAGCGR